MKHNFSGLTDHEVEESRQKNGSNELSPYELESFWSKLWGNFRDPIIIILVVALVVIFVLSLFELTEWYEAVAIGIAVAYGYHQCTNYHHVSQRSRINDSR